MRVLLFLAGLTLITDGNAAAADREAELINQIRRVWLARQDRCDSGIIRWKQDEFYEEGAWGTNARVDSIVLNFEFAFDGKLCTYSLDGPRWNGDKKKFDQESLKNVVNRGGVKMLFAGQRHGRFPAGFICGRQTLSSLRNREIEPAVLTFRPHVPEIPSFRLAEWEVVSPLERIGGRPCIHLVNQQQHLWLDAEREYLPVRHDWLVDHQLWARMDTEYSPHDVAGWVPETWRYTRAAQYDAAGQLHRGISEGYTATVTEVQLNISIPYSTFDIEFPPGTRIKNERTGEKGIVREDGSYRHIDPTERYNSDSWDELMRTDPPSVIQRRRRIWFWSLAIVTGMSLVGMAFHLRHRTV